jgi:hypothetical protein
MSSNEIKKHELKKKQQMNSDESLKPGLIFQIHNPLIFRFGINQEVQFKVER